MKQEETIKRELIYQGSIIDVYVDQVVIDKQQTAKRELVFHRGAVAVLAITDEQKMILVKQYRKAVEAELLEIPAGKIEIGEKNPLLVAKRELEEETAYQAAIWQPITSFYLSPGFSNEKIDLYYATDLKIVEQPLQGDEDERIDLLELTLEEAKAYCAAGKINDAKTMYAILYWEQQIKRMTEV